ncbi:hypothetical protein BA895_04415 [Humibacillus sp. DSM 29435]|uniref:glycosyltransferase family 4 protein n=1 Tax=Humibacillus sp. DSM 29435 TaxID=1869167 RepID=UPI0008729037|nr:glycosyltransferase family 4 protein [Humibacillus sp. DSM 29435]OFE16806.1 hypothetical protein BA895_04415 [Humibacillus sp. DSM 29435]
MTAEATRHALGAVRSAPTLLEAMHRGPGLDAAAASDAATGAEGERAVLTVLGEAIADPHDQLTAAIATVALGSTATEGSARELARMLDTSSDHLREHVVWALGRGPLVPSALSPLAQTVASGGFSGMLAQRTLQRWSPRHPDAVRSALENALAVCPTAVGRSTLVETLALVPGAATQEILRIVATDSDEHPAARAAAVAALADPADREGREGRSRPSDLTRRVLSEIANEPGPLAPVAAIALDDLDGLANGSWQAARRRRQRSDGSGLTVGQLFLHADVDGDLSHAGQGDTGGIATLLVQLGDALLEARPDVRRVLTISRGRPADGVGDLASLHDSGHHYLSIPLWGPNVPAAQAWPLRIATARGLRRVLRAAGDVDVLHLRMGDVATMVAAEVAAEAGLPIVFTLAPDPNALVAARDRAGTLTRANFAGTDAIEHLLFRERLLRELQSTSAHLVLFPRPALDHDMRALMDLDINAEADRVSVVAEGVSMAAIDAATATATATATDEVGTSRASRALSELDDLLAQLPPERRGLPLAVSVGRLTGVKGMVTLVDAWANEGDLHARCNLLVVGGDVRTPTDDERQQLAAIDAVLPLDIAASRGLLLPGHRPNATVAAWLRAVRDGRPDGAAPGGVYVSASLKEEFGIAILEAIATGLVVVAPGSGGPATYVTDGVTGILADTGSRDRLGEAISAALELAVAPGAAERAAEAQNMVRERFGIETMAGALAEVYHRVATSGAQHRESAVAAS